MLPAAVYATLAFFLLAPLADAAFLVFLAAGTVFTLSLFISSISLGFVDCLDEQIQLYFMWGCVKRRGPKTSRIKPCFKGFGHHLFETI